MYERFTEPARQVVILAREEARALKHGYIGTEHLLLGLLRLDDGGLAGRVLAALGIGIEHVRAEVVRIAGCGPEVISTSSGLPFTPRSKKVLEFALREALGLRHNYIGSEHILLGIVKENGGVAARVLLDADADPETIRDEIRRELGIPPRAARPDMPGPTSYIVGGDPSDPKLRTAENLDQRIESIAIRERLMSERLERLRKELAELRAERERLHGPPEPPEQQ